MIKRGRTITAMLHPAMLHKSKRNPRVCVAGLKPQDLKRSKPIRYLSRDNDRSRFEPVIGRAAAYLPIRARFREHCSGGDQENRCYRDTRRK